MRLFIAIPLPEPVVAELTQVQSALRVGRLVAPDQMHVTLAFMPEVAQVALADMHLALQDVQSPVFDMEFGGLDLFGSGRPRLVVAIIRPSEILSRVQVSVVNALRSAGIEVHRQGFRPHVTLARFGGRVSQDNQLELQKFLTEHATTQLPGFEADRFVLTRSTLGHGPPRYEELEEYPFARHTFM